MVVFLQCRLGCLYRCSSLKKLQAVMQQNKFERNGEHYEIYLSDFRKTAPEKLKTILREPVK
jgi:hypothetical protein